MSRHPEPRLKPCQTRYPFGRLLALKLARGDAGTDQTIGAMIGLIEATDAAGIVAALARRMREEARDGRGGENGSILYVLWDWLKDAVRFRPDPRGTELTRSPDQLITEIASHGYTWGDCDDLATLTAALLRAMGLRPVLIVCGRSPAPADFEHVCAGLVAQTHKPNGCEPFDAQESYAPFEWPRVGIVRVRTYIVPPISASNKENRR